MTGRPPAFSVWCGVQWVAFCHYVGRVLFDRVICAGSWNWLFGIWISPTIVRRKPFRESAVHV
jgi:hypothetical protein